MPVCCWLPHACSAGDGRSTSGGSSERVSDSLAVLLEAVAKLLLSDVLPLCQWGGSNHPHYLDRESLAYRVWKLAGLVGPLLPPCLAYHRHHSLLAAADGCERGYRQRRCRHHLRYRALPTPPPHRRPWP